MGCADLNGYKAKMGVNFELMHGFDLNLEQIEYTNNFSLIYLAFPEIRSKVEKCGRKSW